jgi:outer membrane protein assembly factor BamB
MTLSGKPKLLWKLAAGQGYAGAAIAGSQAVLFDRDGNSDRVRLVEMSSGKELWKRELTASYRGGINPDVGPRCVPTLTADSIVIYSASGDLSVLERNTGAVVWTKSLRKLYFAEDGYFGAGSTPLVIDGKIVVNVGGKSISVVCLSIKDGTVLWTAFQGEASYASPIVYRPKSGDGKPLLIVPTRLTTVGLDLDSGAVRWKVPFGQRGPTVNAATPILLKSDRLFLTASYGIGSLTLAPTANKADVIRKDNKISSQYSTPVVVANRIFGCDGREDGDPAEFKCLNVDDESLLWAKAGMPICHSIAVGNQILLCGIDGRLWCIDATADSFTQQWAAQLPGGKYRALPALDGKRLLTRSSEADDNWYCFEFP